METKTTTLGDLRLADNDVKNMPAVTPGFNSLQGFELAQRAARLLASSTMVPENYQGNLPNCVIALNMANRMGADPLMVMQNLHIVYGRPAWSAQFLIATFNMCGRFSSLRFEFAGTEGQDDWGCRAWAIEKSTEEKLTGALVTIGLAKKEGWYGKSGSKWQSMPEQMLRYRAASWFVRAYAPELSMGLQTADEISDTYTAYQSADGTYVVSTDELGQTEPVADDLAAEVTEPPKRMNQIQDDDGEWYWVDSAGERYDELKHAWDKSGGCPSVNGDGTFRAARGSKKKKESERIEENLDAAVNKAFGTDDATV